MKSILVIVALAVLAVAVQNASASQRSNLQKYIRDCIESTGVDEQLVKNSREKGEFADDDKLANYYFCIARKMDFMTEGGEFQPANVKAVVPETVDKEKAYQIIDDCVKVSGSSKEKTAYLAYKCYKEHGFTFA